MVSGGVFLFQVDKEKKRASRMLRDQKKKEEEEREKHKQPDSDLDSWV